MKKSALTRLQPSTCCSEKEEIPCNQHYETSAVKEVPSHLVIFNAILKVLPFIYNFDGNCSKV